MGPPRAPLLPCPSVRIPWPTAPQQPKSELDRGFVPFLCGFRSESCMKVLLMGAGFLVSEPSQHWEIETPRSNAFNPKSSRPEPLNHDASRSPNRTFLSQPWEALVSSRPNPAQDSTKAGLRASFGLGAVGGRREVKGVVRLYCLKGHAA